MTAGCPEWFQKPNSFCRPQSCFDEAEHPAKTIYRELGLPVQDSGRKKLKRETG
jgi:hypothetical protein